VVGGNQKDRRRGEPPGILLAAPRWQKCQERGGKNKNMGFEQELHMERQTEKKKTTEENTAITFWGGAQRPKKKN